jgi:nitric oxide reductase activation protein
VRELPPRPALLHTGVSDDVLRYAAQVRRVFERLRPEEMNVQTRLYEGDEINLDHLLESVVEHRAGRVPDLRVYRKPLVRKRDVAVTVLLDLSGSTADPIHERSRSVPAGEVGPADGARTVMDVEKETAYVLAAGLSVLGDRFSVGGFTGTGRENCIYCRFKGFDDPWDREAVRGLLGSAPGSSTRIGAALRHAGWRLGTEPARTRLLLLMTDGKPCDQGYDTESHYAHHDVRKACEENRALGIHTFCVSTSENTPADMELMFPGGRYVILEDISRLPSVLARVYLRLTR